MKEFDNIIGYKSIKIELQRICDVLKNFDKYENLGVKQPAGILIHGEVGVGKTLMAKTFANATGWNVYIIRKGKPNSDFVKEIAQVYETAKNNQPAVVILDDLDKFSNEDEEHKNSDEFITVQSFIDDMKGLKVFTIATANSINEFPNSLLRIGRFDNIIKVDKPRGEDCKKIIEHYLSKIKYVADLDIEEIAKILDYSSCAELETIVNEAGIYAGAQNKSLIQTDDIIKAYMRLVFGAPESLLEVDKKNIERIAYHEAGHTVISEILEPESINLVSILRHEGATGGIISQNLNMNELFEKKYFENRIMVSFGGRAAIELIYGEIDLGASKDIDTAVRLVNDLISQYCAFGFDTWEDKFIEVYTDLKEKQHNFIDYELSRLYQQGKIILAQNRKFLDEVAQALIEKKTLRAKDIKEIKYKLKLI